MSSDNNCSTFVDPPTFAYFILHSSTLSVVFMVISLFIFVLTLCIYIEEMYFIYASDKFVSWRRRINTIWILTTCPVLSALALLGIFFQRSSYLCDLVSGVYFSIIIFQFVSLMINYYGGQEVLVRELTGTLLPLRRQPFCYLCLPPIVVNRKVIRNIKMLSLQTAIVQPILLYFSAVLYVDGLVIPGQLSLTNAYTYLQFLVLISTMSAMYGVLLMRDLTFPAIKERYHMLPKLLFIFAIMFITRIQPIILGFFATINFIKCTPLLTAKSRSEVIHHYIMVFELLIMAILVRIIYRRVPVEADIDPLLKVEEPTSLLLSREPKSYNTIQTRLKRSLSETDSQFTNVTSLSSSQFSSYQRDSAIQ